MAYNNFYPSPNYNGFFGNGQQYGQMNNQNVPNSGQPNGYQNMNAQQQMLQGQQISPYQAQGNNVQVPLPQPQQQIQDGGFVYVQGELEALKYPVAHGYSVTFKDETAPYLYKKTVGFSLLDVPIFEKYRLVKEETEQDVKRSAQPTQVPAQSNEVPTVQPSSPDYIERKELNDFIDKLDTVSDAIEILKKNFTDIQSKVESLAAKNIVPINREKEKDRKENTK